MTAYGVTQHDNFEAPAPGSLGGKSILEFVGDLNQRPALAGARRKPFEAREKRVHPDRDDAQLALAPTAKQCNRQSRRHCQVPHLVERSHAGRLRRGRPGPSPPRPRPGEGAGG
jgi:hypothetical protein